MALTAGDNRIRHRSGLSCRGCLGGNEADRRDPFRPDTPCRTGLFALE